MAGTFHRRNKQFGLEGSQREKCVSLPRIEGGSDRAVNVRQSPAWQMRLSTSAESPVASNRLANRANFVG
jgi:hypothetical protein